MASTTAAAPPAATKRVLGGGFLQALIRGVKPSSKQPQQQQQNQIDIDIANAENASVLTRAQKRRLSSEPQPAAAAPPADTRKALNVLSDANNHQQQQKQQQQQQRRASKRRSAGSAAGANGKKRSRRVPAAAASGLVPELDSAGGLKMSQESNLGIQNLFGGSQAASSQQQQQLVVPVELCQDLAGQDSVLTSLVETCRYLDHYPYALESFFLDQDLEEVYRRDLPMVDFLQQQQGTSGALRWDMIHVLFDWLVNAHESLELNHETLYLTVKLIYMFLSRRKALPRQSLQLLAIAALWIASKKEELFAVQLRQLTYLTLDEYSPRQVMSMEQQVLSAIDFRINWPLSYNYLRRYMRVIDHEHQVMSFLARYLLELSLLDHQLNLERESAKAAAALWLARAQLGLQPLWPLHLQYSTAWTEAELAPIARRLNDMSAQQLANSLGAGGRGPLSTTFHKYSNAIFKKVALTPALPSDSELLHRDRRG